MSVREEHIACKNADTLWKVWNRLNRGEISDLLKVWGNYSSRLGSYRRKKETLGSLVNHEYSEGLTHKQLADIDFVLFERRKEDIEWEVHAFSSNGSVVNRLSNNPVELETNLRNNLNVFFPHHTTVRLVEGKYLIRIEVWDGVPYDKESFDFDTGLDDNRIAYLDIPSRNQVMYCVYIPHSEHLFMTPVVDLYYDCILEGLYNTFQMVEFGKIDISGKSVDSLAELILKQQAQGIYAAFLPSEEARSGKDGPLQEISRFRSRQLFGENRKDLVVSENSLAGNISVEDDLQQDRKEIALMEAFGGQLSSLPILQRVRYYVAGASGFHSEALPEVTGRFRMRVQFEGPHVLDGLRECVKMNIADLPMNPNLQLIAASGRNEFVIDEE